MSQRDHSFLNHISLWDRLTGPFIRWHVRRNCFHHDHKSGISYMQERLIDLGMRKMYICSRCEKVFF